ncbi:hypothetical protein [Emcibacter nanhaiensis]|uniref:SH3 domain-containing protein n=1 Tax=Emcibacter nanhaiensis TaxID=1505037 RepID=A0A501PGI6_9PROT|nr:hypothetical protein [Emcibacter nanhaiensis]TPD58986.1 hypothetical protein FIV46_12175 [Emcibacter nanhaiensis]
MTDYIVIILFLWGLYSIVGLVFPIAPFSSRKAASISLVITIALLFFSRPLLERKGSDQTLDDFKLDQTRETADSAIKENAIRDVKIPEPCGQGGIAMGDVVAVTGEHLLHASADQNSSKIKNVKASNILGKDHFHQIDSSTTVRRLCVQEEWAEVQIVTPDWLTHVKGWVPNTALREIESNEYGGRIYVEEDFYWDSETSQFKKDIINIVNKISHENENCESIDPYTVAKSTSQSSPGDPVFFVTCGSGVDAFNVWFRPSDADVDTTFLAKKPLGKVSAVNQCEEVAKKAALNPSTVEFSKLWDLAYLPHKSGRERVISTFTAKNSLNMERSYRINCLFDGSQLIEIQIAEQTS